MLTVAQLLDGRGINYPHVFGANITHRRAARATGPALEQPSLFPASDES